MTLLLSMNRLLSSVSVSSKESDSTSLSEIDKILKFVKFWMPSRFVSMFLEKSANQMKEKSISLNGLKSLTLLLAKLISLMSTQLVRFCKSETLLSSRYTTLSLLSVEKGGRGVI